jgi:hypothetical protein
MSDPSERISASTAWERYLPSVVAFLLAVALGTVILHVYSSKLAEPAAGLVKSLIWPSFAVIVVLLFRQQTEALLSTVNAKIAAATKLEVHGFSFESVPQRIPVPKTGEPITLANIALIHTSFLRPDKTLEFNDGLNYFQIEVAVVAPQPTLDRIESVTYRLDEAYRKNLYEIADRQSRFKLKELANALRSCGRKSSTKGKTSLSI